MDNVISPDLSAADLAAWAAGTAAGYGAGALAHHAAEKKRGKLAKSLRAATPWVKLVAGTIAGAAAAAVLSGVALPAALVTGVVAGISAIAGRQLIVKPVIVMSEPDDNTVP